MHSSDCDARSKKSPVPFIGNKIIANSHICDSLKFQGKTYSETTAAFGSSAPGFSIDWRRAHSKIILSTNRSIVRHPQFLTLVEHMLVQILWYRTVRKGSSGGAVIRHRVPCVHHGAHFLHGILKLLRSILVSIATSARPKQKQIQYRKDRIGRKAHTNLQQPSRSSQV